MLTTSPCGHHRSVSKSGEAEGEENRSPKGDVLLYELDELWGLVELELEELLSDEGVSEGEDDDDEGLTAELCDDDEEFDGPELDDRLEDDPHPSQLSNVLSMVMLSVGFCSAGPAL
jgi:hypothetical protein